MRKVADLGECFQSLVGLDNNQFHRKKERAEEGELDWLGMIAEVDMSQSNMHADMMPSCYASSRLRYAKFCIPVFTDAHRRVQVEEKKKELVRRNFS